MAENIFRKPETGFFRNRAAVLFHFGKNGTVIFRVDDDGLKLKILRCRSEHCRAADIDLFDGFIERNAALCDGLLEWVEVDNNHIDR